MINLYSHAMGPWLLYLDFQGTTVVLRTQHLIQRHNTSLDKGHNNHNTAKKLVGILPQNLRPKRGIQKIHQGSFASLLVSSKQIYITSAIETTRKFSKKNLIKFIKHQGGVTTTLRRGTRNDHLPNNVIGAV